nr:ESX secretion-associated protein EspG [Kibdelosporangium persicum]
MRHRRLDRRSWRGRQAACRRAACRRPSTTDGGGHPARRRRRGVRAVATEEEVSVRRIPPSGLGSQAAALLPSVAEGYGRSVSVPTEALQAAAHAAGDDMRSLRSHLERQGVSQDVAHLVAVMNQDTVGTAQFGMTVCVGDRVRRAEHVIGWWATKTGGYLAQQRRSSSNECWTTMTPAGNAKLAHQIDSELARLSRQAGVQ